MAVNSVWHRFLCNNRTFNGVKYHLVFIMDYAYYILLSKDFDPDNRPVHFGSSGVLLLNLAGLKY